MNQTNAYRHSRMGLAACGLASIFLAGCWWDGNGHKTAAPVITSQPASATVFAGQAASFSVTASGTSLTYQWQKGGTNVSGGTAATLSLASAATGDAGSYTVVVSNAGGSVTSSAATLAVNGPPAISTQPANASATAGGTATFSVTATGLQLTYQWKRNGTAVTGATSASYTTPALAVSDDQAVYTVTVTNPAGNVTSSGATLTVTAAVAACAGEASTFAANVAAASSSVITLAGSGSAGAANAVGTAATFNAPQGVAATSVNGTVVVYVADTGNNLIRRIDAATGAVTTLAGSTSGGYADGTGTAALFSQPAGVAIDGNGNAYVADAGNHAIRKITPAGVVCTVAGTGSSGYVDGAGAQAEFNTPVGVTVDKHGNLYVADFYNFRIRKIDTAGVVSTLAGNGEQAYLDGVGTAAKFARPHAVSVDVNGDYLYDVDTDTPVVRKIAIATATVTTLAGSTSGYADGVGSAAQLGFPYGVAVDDNGTLLLADTWNNRIRRVLADGTVSTEAGNGTAGLVNGASASALTSTVEFNWANGIAVGAGSIWVADTSNNVIRRLEH